MRQTHPPPSLPPHSLLPPLNALTTWPQFSRMAYSPSQRFLRWVLLCIWCVTASGMRRGSSINTVRWRPRAPDRCWVPSLILPLGRYCRDPDCLITSCPEWPPIDHLTGKRVRPSKKDTLTPVISLLEDLGKLKALLATKSPQEKRREENKKFLCYASILFCGIVVVPSLVLCCIKCSSKK